MTLSKDQIQFAGEFLLEDCTIVSTTGAEYNIVELVQEINIYENLYQASISGDIVIKDTNNIVDNFPIIGEERLSLKIMKPKKSLFTFIQVGRLKIVLEHLKFYLTVILFKLKY